MNIKTKTFLTIFPVVVVCLSILGFLGDYYFQSAIRDTFLRGVDLHVERLSEQLSASLRVAKADAKYLKNSDDLRKFVNGKSPKMSVYLAQYQLNKVLEKFLVDDKPYLYLSIFSPDGKTIAVASADNDPFFVGNDGDKDIVKLAKLSSEPVYVKIGTPNNGEQIELSYTVVVAFRALGFPMSLPDDSEYRVLLKVDLRRVLPPTQIFFSEHGYNYNLADANGSLLLTDSSLDGVDSIDISQLTGLSEGASNHNFARVLEGGNYSFVAKKMQDMYLIAFLPEGRIKRESIDFRIVILITTIIAIFLVAWILLLTIDRTLIIPIKNIMNTVNSRSSHRPQLSVHHAGDDELTELDNAYKAMLEERESHNENLERTVIERTQELSLALERAKEYDRAKSQFLANMSHEIRTPMNGVLGMVSLLENTPLSDRQKSFTEHISSSSANLLTVINDILDISRIELGKFELVEADFQLATLIEKIIEFYTEEALKNGLSLHLVNNVELSFALSGDAGRLRQVLVNLLGNAIKFTDHGVIEVAINSVEHEPGTIVLEFSVSDTGIGIAESARSHIFESFTQADSSSTRRHGGSGLGLAICRELVELMHGEISVESKVGVGSTFIFTAAFKKSMGSGEVLIRAVPGADPVVDTNRLAGKKVLLCEDNEVNQEVTRLTLENFGCSVEIAKNGHVGLQLFQHNHYDLILMDCQMPVMDGFEATHAIREIEVGRNASHRIPIIALTAHAMKGYSDRCIEAGMDAYLSKPFTAEQIAETMGAALL
ncbi:MAG: signal transduction histidine kinase/CheY-like chemotaxis protein [Porticoccaceae bacterium]